MDLIPTVLLGSPRNYSRSKVESSGPVKANYTQCDGGLFSLILRWVMGDHWYNPVFIPAPSPAPLFDRVFISKDHIEAAQGFTSRAPPLF